MKKWIALFLIVTMLFGGCVNQNTEPLEQPTVSTSSTPTGSEPSQPTTPTEPEISAPRPNYGLYERESQIELATNGAVKKFALEQTDCYAVLPIGHDLLVFSGYTDTVLTLYREEQEPISVTVKNNVLFPDGYSTRVMNDGFAYYDSTNDTVVYLDNDLNVKDSIEIPAGIVGFPGITADWSRVYYFTDSGLYYVDVETGISKILREMTFPLQGVDNLLFQDSVIVCYVSGEEYGQTQYLSAVTGELIFATDSIPSVYTDDQWYFATYYDSVSEQLLFGKRDGAVQALTPNQENDGVVALQQLRSVMLQQMTDDGILLNLYDLTSGKRASSVALPGLCLPWSVNAGVNPQRIWFLAADSEDYETGLYCWEPDQSPTDDTQNYVGPYYTAANPDTAGLERIKQELSKLEEQYGIRIRMYESATKVPPSDYSFTAEHRVPVYEHYLPMLERALAAYPEGFLKKLGKGTSDNEKLTICLVSGAYGENEAGALSTADGVQYIRNGNFYVAVVMNESFESTLYHEIYHAMDIYILGQISNYDFWDTLNPEGFYYDNDYLANQGREDYQYLEDENRYFIDMYSMSFAKEDRARVMEYAMQAGNESYFQSTHMQAKLSMLCKAIRQVFGMKKYTGQLVWEQYLAQ